MFGRLGFVAALSVALGPTALAQPLPDTDHTPLTGIYGFLSATESARLPDPGQSRWLLTLSTASHNILEVRGDEQLLLDGETSRLSLMFERRVSERWSVGVELPYVAHESGGLDSVIENWHSVFGLPDGPRADRPRDLLEFTYTDQGLPGLQLNRNVNGVGDIRLLAARTLREDPDRPLALRLSVELPTGDSDELLGSGGTEVSVGLAGDIASMGGNEKLSSFYRVGATWIADSDILAERSNEIVGLLAAGLAWQVHDRISLLVQGRVRSAVYDSAIPVLGDPSLTTTFGVGIRLNDRRSLMISVGEDLSPDTAPDVIFQISLLSGTF